jgi:hypothetical protein
MAMQVLLVEAAPTENLSYGNLDFLYDRSLILSPLPT